MNKPAFDIWQKEREQAEDLGVIKVFRGVSISGKLYAMLWTKNAFRPFAHYSFRDLEHREIYIKEQLSNVQAHKNIVEERKIQRKGTTEDLNKVQVGSIFHYSWGYDQTNCQFYQVIAKEGQFVEVREIGQERAGNHCGGSMSEDRIATKDAFLKDTPIMKKKLQFSQGTPYITIESYGWCSLWDGKPEYCSWYA